MNFPKYYALTQKKEFDQIGNNLVCKNEKIPIVNGIPRFVKQDNYAAAFGAQWKKYRRTQLDSYTNTNITAKRMEGCFEKKTFNSLEGKSVLETGCGAGRFTEILLQKGAYVTSLDLSDAVDANSENFPINEKHRILQGDINKMPFAPQQYDFVVCLGVIQHTPNPEETITSLYQHVKPGGWLVIDHYTYKLSHFTKTTEIFRFFLKRLSPTRGMKVTERITNLFFPLHKAVRKVYPLQAILSRISPVHSYYFAYPHLSHEDQYQWSLLDTHDSLTDWYKHLRTPKQIYKHLEQIGGTNIYSEKSPHGVDARCQRPL